jgi:hypothetical protein
MFVAPLVVAAFVAATLRDRRLYDLLVNEDGILEWLELFGFTVAALLGFVLTRRFHRGGARGLAALYLAFGLGCFAIAGEEISWGQRLFDVDTPPALARVNTQEETTIHNISALRVTVHVGYILLGLGGGIVAWVARLHSWFRRGGLLEWITPPLFLSSAYLLLLIYRLGRSTFDTYDRSAVGRYGEVTELALAFGLAAFGALQLRRLRQGSAWLPTATGGSGPRITASGRSGTSPAPR